MRTDHACLAARARGLAQHLCTRDELERLAALPDLAAFAKALQAGGRTVTPLPPAPTAADVDAAMRRSAAAALAVFGRWAGPAHPLLRLFEAEQDRRSLRALLRGAAEGAPAEQRLAGLLPTLQLSPARRADLARAPAPREVALRLLVLRDPHAQALLALTASPRVDLLEVERTLARTLAQRWREALARADKGLRAWLREGVDLVNAEAALLLAGAPGEFDAETLFVDGGRSLVRDAFVAAATAASRSAAAQRLAQAFSGSTLAHLFRPPPEDPARLEAAALRERIERLRHRARLDPLGCAPALLYLARLEAQQRDLRRLAWGLQLGLPAAVLREGLVTS
jgi:vacuolar-type H+-ATPase subunit C/Vma6